jgi:hypothetical protein
MKVLRFVRPQLMTFGLSVALVQPALAQLEAIVTRELHHDLSPRVRDLKPGPAEGSDFEAEEEALRPALPDLPNPLLADPAQQNAQGMPLPVSVNLNFDGLGDGVYGFTVHASPPVAFGSRWPDASTRRLSEFLYAIRQR